MQNNKHADVERFVEYLKSKKDANIDLSEANEITNLVLFIDGACADDEGIVDFLDFEYKEKIFLFLCLLMMDLRVDENLTSCLFEKYKEIIKDNIQENVEFPGETLEKESHTILGWASKMNRRTIEEKLISYFAEIKVDQLTNNNFLWLRDDTNTIIGDNMITTTRYGIITETHYDNNGRYLFDVTIFPKNN